MDTLGQSSREYADGAVKGESLLAKGRRLERDGLYAEAVAFYTSLLADGPPDSRWHYRLGCTCLKNGDPVAAEQAFRSAVDLEPDNPRYLTNLGVALDRLGRREDAVRSYKRAARQGGGTVVAHHNLGAIYAEQGRMDEAVRCFAAAIALEPDAEGYHNLGLVHYRNDDFSQALECFRQSIACDAGYAVGHYYCGLCLMKTGNYAEAVKAFRHAWELDARLTRTPFYLGCCLHKLERFAEARDLLEQALESFPDDGRIHYQLALTCDALGLHPEARLHYGRTGSRAGGRM